jgi:hypothetical protein
MPLVWTSTDKTIEWLTATSTHRQHMMEQDETRVHAELGQPHPGVLAIVSAAGDDGIDIPALKLQIELGMRLSKSVKTARLAAYVKALPTTFRVQTVAADDGALRDTVFAIEAPLDSAEWQHASRFTSPPRSEAATGGLDVWWEFLDAQGIDLHTVRLMSISELVGLGVSTDDASRLLAGARLAGGGESSGASVDVHAEQFDDEANRRSDCETRMSSREAALQQQVAELLQRCSDLQLRVSVLEEARMCCICMENKRDTVVMPCMHAMFCSTCLRGPTPAKNCPTCRSPIQGLVECRLDMVDEEHS